MFDLDLITDRSLLPNQSLVEVAKRALGAAPAGRVGVQLREKDLEGGPLTRLADSMQRVCAQAGAPMLVNGRADVARAVGAAGVHLPSDGLPCEALRAWWPDALIGVSAHSRVEVKQAFVAGADFATLGPVWQTPSKARYGAPLGLSPLAPPWPSAKTVYALGGVDQERAGLAIEAGAGGVSCIRAVLCADDPGLAVSKLLEAIDSSRESLR